MRVNVQFNLDDRWREEEKKSTSAQDLLERLIYDFQCGMVTINSIDFSSRKYNVRILPDKKDE